MNQRLMSLIKFGQKVNDIRGLFYRNRDKLKMELVRLNTRSSTTI